MIYLTSFHAIEEHILAEKSSGMLLVAKTSPRALELVALATRYHIRVNRTGTVELNRLAPDNRGIALALESGTIMLTLEHFIESLDARERAIVVMLDSINDPHNYGAILRSCDQFGVDLVVTRTRRSAHNAKSVAQTSAGAVAWVPHCETPNLNRAVEKLKNAGFWIYGADMRGEKIYTKEFSGRVTLILGNEGTGLSRLLAECCDALVAIPTVGQLDSLNVSVAAGIFLYEFVRQNNSH
ncbi:MAG: 23S rRNA (guanosine(2251)-2'-O)-methyltransferase RlmB [Treponema sp.]|jgi:23S rRNA (guanosine2251-2'-O)-methyltransferase|nr:23S rRNA (guanosine(2251)-2'-O)-methyltransferase RlmB [Treponema sp.]